MTKAEFDRAKSIEYDITSMQNTLKHLKAIFNENRPLHIVAFPSPHHCYIPDDVKSEIFNFINESYEKQLTELQSEFDSLVQE